MSKIEELVKQYCPNGVEYKALVDIANITIGEFVHQNYQTPDGKYPVYNGGTSNTGYYEKCNHKKDNIIISARGANAGYVNRVLVDYWAGNSCYSVDVIQRDKINWCYIYYVLKNMQTDLITVQQRGSIPAVSKKQIEQIKVPVPPLPVQEEIVKILDAFTSLEAELEAELEARKKQYEYYRNQLLSFDENTTGGGRIKFMQLGDVCSIKGRIGFRGYTRDDLVEPHQGAISLSPANIVNNSMKYTNSTYVSWEKYNESPEIMIEKNDVVFCKTGSTIGKVSIIKELPEPATINPQLVVLKNIKCNPSYLSYILASSYFQGIVHKIKGVGSVPTLSQKDLANQLIPIPPLDEQERIVAILDKFDSLVNDISEGLPAEINARKQQYEHYRNQLLTFDEAA